MSSLDSEFERYRAAAQERTEEAGDDLAPARDVIRTARFELHAWIRDVGQHATIEQAIEDAFGATWDKHDRVTPAGIKTVWTWDVEDPSTCGPAARNLNVLAAETTKRDSYLVWYALTGFPMMYEVGS